MIKCDLGNIVIDGSLCTIQAELELLIREIKELFVKKYGEETAQKLIDEVFEGSMKPEDERSKDIADAIENEIIKDIKKFIKEVLKDE